MRRGSKRLSIRNAILRRLETGESLAIRTILTEAGGGSTDTVREELRELTGEQARSVQALKIVMASPSHQIHDLRSRLEIALARESELVAENAGLRAVIDRTGDTITYLTARHDDTYRSLMVACDDYRSKAAQEGQRLAESLVKSEPPPEKVREVFVADPMIEGLYKVKVQELARAHQKINALEQEIKFLQSKSSLPEQQGRVVVVETETDDDDELYESD
jgi:hypothetical protein